MIPITIVTGFLGSGKTSLIAHLLDATSRRRIAVIVNDLAKESVDTAFLNGGEHIEQRNSELLRSIPGGRIGAGKRDLVIEEIASILSVDQPVEAIVIETSGSSPAFDLRDMIAENRDLSQHVRVDTVITVVDTSTFPDYWRDPQLHPLLVDQLSAADLIILNKYDRVGYWRRRKSRTIIARNFPTAQVGSSEFGRLPVNEVIDTKRLQRDNAQERPRRVVNTDFRPVVARVLKEERPFHPERLDRWLNEEWPGIIRVKGFAWLATDMEHVYVIDVAGPQREIGIEGTWYAALPPDDIPEDPEITNAIESRPYGDRTQTLTIIGVPDAVEREMRNLRACLLSRPELDRGPRGWQQMTDPIAQRFAGQSR